jgi:hypothetical protein
MRLEGWLADRFAAPFIATTGHHGTFSLLTLFELCPGHSENRDRVQGTTMVDRDGLKFVGFIFATVTLAVMLATGMVVKGYADGVYSLEGRAIASR